MIRLVEPIYETATKEEVTRTGLYDAIEVVVIEAMVELDSTHLHSGGNERHHDSTEKVACG